MVVVNSEKICSDKTAFIDYQEKKRKVEEILENKGIERNSWLTKKDEKNEIPLGEISQIVLDIAEVYQVLLNKNDNEMLSNLEKIAKSFTNVILDCYCKAFDDLVKIGYEVEKVDNYNLRKIVEALALSKILKKEREI